MSEHVERSTPLNEGRRVEVIRDEGLYWTRDRVQALCDAEKAHYDDCWGQQ